MEEEDYELVPLRDVQKLKDGVKKLRKSGSQGDIANSLDRLSTSLERLFEIFHVAASEIERDNLDTKSFDEKIAPIMQKLSQIEEQNRDIAEGILALADIVKSSKHTEKPVEKFQPKFQPMPEMNFNPSFDEELPPPPALK